MNSFLAGIPLGQISAGALVGLFFLLMFLGRIPTLRELRDSQKREERAMELAEGWQRVATEHGMTLEKHTATLEKLLTNDDAILHVVQEIQRAGEGR